MPLSPLWRATMVGFEYEVDLRAWPGKLGGDKSFGHMALSNVNVAFLPRYSGLVSP